MRDDARETLEYSGPWQAPVSIACIRDSDLSQGARLLYANLCGYMNAERVAWPGRKRLAADLGASTKSIDRYVNELVEGGWVKVIHDYDPETKTYGTNRYIVYGVCQKKAEVNTDPLPTGVATLSPSVSPPSPHRCPQGRDTSVHKTNPIELNQELNPENGEAGAANAPPAGTPTEPAGEQLEPNQSAVEPDAAFEAPPPTPPSSAPPPAPPAPSEPEPNAKELTVNAAMQLVRDDPAGGEDLARALLAQEQARASPRKTLVGQLEDWLDPAKALNRHPAIQAYRDVANFYPVDAMRQDIVDAVGDAPEALEFWGKVVKDWIGSGAGPRNVVGMLQRFQAGELLSESYRSRANGRGKPAGKQKRGGPVPGRDPAAYGLGG